MVAHRKSFKNAAVGTDRLPRSFAPANGLLVLGVRGGALTTGMVRRSE
jgi:hypothetical protein